MKRAFLIFALSISLAACAPSVAEPTVDVGAIQTSAVETTLAQPTLAAPTRTPRPTRTPSPTRTPAPRATSTPARSLEEIRQGLIDAVVKDLSNFSEVESVSLVRFNEGALEIEIKTVWASQDRQPDISWTIVQQFSGSLADSDQGTLETIAGGPFVIALTTYSTDGGYRYQSLTDWATIEKLGSKSISYTEWVVAAGAGFK